MEFRDYYKILGVERSAAAEQIKTAYRRLARKFHPDVSKEPRAEERFKEVQEAYEVLKDPEKRAAYDQLGADHRSGQQFRPPPGWEGRFHRSEEAEVDPGFSEFFSSLFGGAGPFAERGRGRGRGARVRGEDTQGQIEVTLEEAYRGTTRTLELKQPQI